MSMSILAWLLVAVFLFWAVGAYNRVMRLRMQTIQSFISVDERLLQLLLLSQSGLLQEAADPQSQRAGLQTAATALEAALRASRAHPFDGLLVRALAAAYQNLQEAWRQCCEVPPDLAGHLYPDNLTRQWREMTLRVETARDQFNRCVSEYNMAIALFPAWLLARMLHLLPAQEF